MAYEPRAFAKALAPVHASVAGVWLDVTTSERYRQPVAVTGAPVEGSGVRHYRARPGPFETTITCIISNHPIEVPGSHIEGALVDPAPILGEGEPAVLRLPFAGLVAANRSAYGGGVGQPRTIAIDALHFDRPFDRVQAVMAAFFDVARRGEPVELITGVMHSLQMTISDVESARVPDLGDACEITFSAIEVSIAYSETGEAVPDPVHPRSEPKQANGKTDDEVVDDATAKKSGLAKLIDGSSTFHPWSDW